MATRILASIGRFRAPLTSTTIVLRSTSTAAARQNSNQPANQSPPVNIWGSYKQKMGETGKLTLGIGVLATCLSKEIIVLHSETFAVVLTVGWIVFAVTKFGKPVAAYLDKYTQNVLDSYNERKQRKVDYLEEAIRRNEDIEAGVGQLETIFDIKRDKADMVREETYRKRLHEARAEVVRRLNYHVQCDVLKKRYEHRHLVSWLEDAVRKSLEKRKDDSITASLATLKNLPVRA